MNAVAALTFPVLAFTPNGVMPYSRYDSLRRVMKHEYDTNWYEDLEIVDAKGACVVVRSARIAKQSFMAKVLGSLVEVEIQEAEKLTDYDVESMRRRVLEFLSLYPGAYQTAGVYDEVVKRVRKSATSADVVKALL